MYWNIIYFFYPFLKRTGIENKSVFKKIKNETWKMQNTWLIDQYGKPTDHEEPFGFSYYKLFSIISYCDLKTSIYVITFNLIIYLLAFKMVHLWALFCRLYFLAFGQSGVVTSAKANNYYI